MNLYSRKPRTYVETMLLLIDAGLSYDEANAIARSVAGRS